jgi:hypothetical protein
MASRVAARRQHLLCDGDRWCRGEKTAEHNSLDYGGGRRVSAATLRGATGKSGGVRPRETSELGKLKQTNRKAQTSKYESSIAGGSAP